MGQISFTVSDLATVAGCGAVTLALLQLLVKPLLAALAGVPWLAAWRALLVNLSALAVSVGLAFLAGAVAGINYASGLQAFLTGLGGAMAATTAFEVADNVIRAVHS